jgi:small subunit ribosomal protein S7
MSRRTIAKKRLITPDPIYRSRLVSMILNRLLQDGKKNIARKIFYSAMESLSIPGPGPSDKRNDSRKDLGTPVKASQSQGLDLASEKSIGSSKVKDQENALKIFQQAILNITPVVEVKSRRVGGANLQVPLEVNAERGTSLALRWLVQAARKRSGREMSLKLANEITDASNKTGGAVKKRDESHRMAEANKANSTFRF